MGRKSSEESVRSSRSSKKLFDEKGEELDYIPNTPEMAVPGTIIEDPIMPVSELNENGGDEGLLFFTTPEVSRPSTPGSSGKKKRKRRSKGDYDWDRKSAD